ncbi:MAG: hypothetical protein HQL31_06195 [Planctomycetes bacterium]|nr:hypothetical protein [Planctomycetota bacterium]
MTDRPDIAGMLVQLNRDELSICAGMYHDYGCLPRYWQGTYEIKNRTLIRHFRNLKTDGQGVVLYDFTHNFFLARTCDILALLWDEKIKIGPEHDDFFLRAGYEGLRISVALDSRVDHYPSYLMRDYKPYRSRGNLYQHYFLEKHGIRKIEIRANPLDALDRIRNQHFRLKHYLLSRFPNRILGVKSTESA